MFEFRQLKRQLEEAAVRIREEETALGNQKVVMVVHCHSPTSCCSIVLKVVDMQAEWETAREGELQKLKLERKALEQQSRAVATLPSRKERNEVWSQTSCSFKRAVP